MREDDPARALSAAAEVISRFQDLAADAAQTRGVTLDIRIGVNTGEVIAPSEVRPDRPVVTGDAVNVAARLQSVAEPGGILVGERTFTATRSLFTFGEAIELQLKGKAQPITAYPLLARVEGAIEAAPRATSRPGSSAGIASSPCSARCWMTPLRPRLRAWPSSTGQPGSGKAAWYARRWRSRQPSDRISWSCVVGARPSAVR